MHQWSVCLSSPSIAFPAARTRALTSLLASTGPNGVTPIPSPTYPTPFISYWRKRDFPNMVPWKYVCIQRSFLYNAVCMSNCFTSVVEIPAAYRSKISQNCQFVPTHVYHAFAPLLGVKHTA